MLQTEYTCSSVLTYCDRLKIFGWLLLNVLYCKYQRKDMNLVTFLSSLSLIFFSCCFLLAFLNFATLQLFFDLYRALPTSLSPMVSGHSMNLNRELNACKTHGKIKQVLYANHSLYAV